MNDVSFFDKIINVTFYKWIEDNDNKQIKLDAAFTIRSDRPGIGYNYFQAVRPPAFESNEETIGYTMTTRTQALFEYGGKKDTKIQNYGVKPNMKLTLSQLPETVCTQVQLTIENLTLEIDIKEYTAMMIEAGYSYSNGKITLAQTFYAGIFSAYVESPNPAGRSIFTGIVGNWFVKGLRAQPYTVSFQEGTYSIKDIISIVCSYLGIIPKVELPPACLQWPIAVQSNWGGSARAQSAYQVIDWLANELMNLTKEWRLTSQDGLPILRPDELVAAFFQDDIFYVCISSTIREEDKKSIAVDLNRISSASFQGGTLYINAPWNPKLLPGQICHINPVYFRGRLLPTSVTKPGGGIADEANLYRPITIDVSFETASGVNQMRVKAVAAHLETWNVNEGLKADTGQNLPATYRDDEGKEVSVTPEQYKANTLGTQANQAYDRGTAAFYPSEGNPYNVGILRQYQDEVEERMKIGLEAQDKKGTNDIYIRIDKDRIDAWNDIIQDLSESTAGEREKGAKANPGKPKYLELNDPARDSDFQGKVGDVFEIPFVPLMEWRSQTRAKKFDKGAYSLVSGTLDYMADNGALPDRIYYILKRVVKEMDTEARDITEEAPRVSLLTLIRVIAAVASAKKAVDAMGDEDPLLFKDIWWGNVFCMAPVADMYTNERIRSIFPDPSYPSRYHSFFVPKIMSGSDLGTLLDDHGDYIDAVIEYWEDLQTNDPGVVSSNSLLSSDIRELETLLRWHRDYPGTPWEAYTASGELLSLGV